VKPLPAIQESLRLWVTELDAIDEPKSFSGSGLNRAIARIPVLPGILCHDCTFIAGTEATMVKHRQEKHQGKEKNLWSNCSCQQVWGNYHKSYSLVLDHSTFNGAEALEDSSDILKAAQEAFNNARRESDKRFTQVPMAIHPRETTPWIRGPSGHRSLRDWTLPQLGN
jgi:hypothetical protein